MNKQVWSRVRDSLFLTDANAANPQSTLLGGKSLEGKETKPNAK